MLFAKSVVDNQLYPMSEVRQVHQLARWNALSSVCLDAGSDMRPGVAGVDDDGNGVVDDLSELGATGTDDQILTPADGDAYTVAVSSPSSRVVSHGAMLPIWSSDSLSLCSKPSSKSPSPLSFESMPSTSKANSIADSSHSAKLLVAPPTAIPITSDHAPHGFCRQTTVRTFP